MPMPSKMRAIAAREKKPIAQILIEKYQHHGQQKKVAAELEISPSTLSHWLAILHLREKTIVVRQNEEPSEAVHA